MNSNLETMTRPTLWKYWPFLPIKRNRADQPPEFALLYDTPPPFMVFYGTLKDTKQLSVVEMDKRSKAYLGLTDLVRDGWVVRAEPNA